VIERRRRQVVRLYSAGYTIVEIAAALKEEKYPGSSKSNVSRDLERARLQWREDVIGDLEGVKTRHLGELESLRQYWTRQIVTGNIGIDERVDITARILIPLLKERAKLLGAYAPAKIDLTAEVREWADRNGFDPQEAVDAAAEIVKEMAKK
jgi:hypothetical protein